MGVSSKLSEVKRLEKYYSARHLPNGVCTRYYDWLELEFIVFFSFVLSEKRGFKVGV